MSKTSAEDTSTQAVSPLSIFGAAGAAAGAAACAAGAGAVCGGVVDCANAAGALTSARTHSNSVIVVDPVLLIPAMTSLSDVIQRRSDGDRSERALVPFTRPDTHRGIDGLDEDLAVTDIARLGGSREDPRHLVDEVVGDHDLHLDLRKEVDRVLAAPVQLGVALLPTEPSHLGHGHADDADAGQRFLHVVE